MIQLHEARNEVKHQMLNTGRAFTARVNPGALKMALAFHNLSLRDAERRTGASRSIIGHLASGARKTCNPETAAKIEKGLGVPSGSIFLLEALQLHETENAA